MSIPEQETTGTTASSGTFNNQPAATAGDDPSLESNERYRLLFDTLIEGFCVVEMIFTEGGAPADYRFLEVNPAFERQTGFKDARGKRMRELVPEHEEKWFEIFGRIAVTGEPARFVSEARAMGRWYEVSAFRLGGSGSRKVAIHFIDVTERKAVEETLVQSARRESERAAELQALLDAVPVAVFIAHDRRCGRITGNRAGDALLQISRGAEASLSAPDGKRPRHFRAVKDERELESKELPAQRAARGNTVQDFEFSLLFEDGARRDLVANATPLSDDQGQPRGSVSVLVDITEQKMRENRLRQLTHDLEAKNHDLEALLYAASHDLRSPLVNVTGFTELLTEQADLLRTLVRGAAEGRPPAGDVLEHSIAEIDQSLGFIRASTAKMNGLLNGLLTFFRLGRSLPPLRPVDAEAILQECLAAIRFQLDDAGVQVTAQSLPPCIADPALLGQVFSNIIDNAIKYRDRERALLLHITTRMEGPRTCYCFTDNGVGIAPEHRLKVFELFHRLNPRRADGFGMGLAVVRRAVEQMSGEVAIDSGLAQGTAFIVSLQSVPEYGLLE